MLSTMTLESTLEVLTTKAMKSTQRSLKIDDWFVAWPLRSVFNRISVIDTRGLMFLEIATSSKAVFANK